MNSNDPRITLLPENRQRQYSIFFIVLFIIASIFNVIITINEQVVIKSWQDLWKPIISVIVVLISTLSLIFFFKKDYSLSAKILIAAWITLQFSQIFLWQGIGFASGIATVVLISIIGILLIPSGQIGYTILTGIGAGIVIVILDLFLSIPRNSIASFTLIIIIILLSLATILMLFLIFHFLNTFDLFTKTLLSLIFSSLVPVIIIGVIITHFTKSALETSADADLLISAEQTAFVLDNFINENLDNIRVEARIAVLSDYIEMSPALSLGDEIVSENALAILRTLSRKDTLFIESYAILDRNGINRIDTNTQFINTNESDYDYFTQPKQTGYPFASPVYVDGVGHAFLVFSSPIRGSTGETLGVLRVRYNASVLQHIINNQNGLSGEKSFCMIVDENGIVLADGHSSKSVNKTLSPVSVDILTVYQEKGLLPDCSVFECTNNFVDLTEKLEGNTHQNITFLITEPTGTNRPVEGAVVPLSTQPWQVVYIQESAILFAPAIRQTRAIAMFAGAITIFVAIFASVVSRMIVSPLQQLTQIANQFSQGDFKAQATVNNNDEIGALAKSINNMSSRLRETIATLEDRVSERTRNIEQRAILLRTAADIGKVASGTHDLSILLQQTVELISSGFGFYHVGVFFLDEQGEFAVLKATNSDGGKHMLERGHKLKIGKTGIVGHTVSEKKARIALDVGDDSVFFDNPDLPLTRSEMALPLLAGDKVLGAIDVQSTEIHAFQEDDIAALQIMADQIAIAIENIHLLERERTAAEATRKAYRDLELKGWHQILHERSDIAYTISAGGEIRTAPEVNSPEYLEAVKSGKPVLSDDRTILFHPVHIRGAIIGGFRLEKQDHSNWIDNEIDLVTNLAVQIGLALESARLFEETTTRAEREKLVTEITTKIRNESDPQSMLDTALESLKQVLGVSDIRIQTYNNHVQD